MFCGKGLCVGLINRPDEFYTGCGVSNVCDREAPLG
jgi:hypothetical protein